MDSIVYLSDHLYETYNFNLCDTPAGGMTRRFSRSVTVGWTLVACACVTLWWILQVRIANNIIDNVDGK